MINKFVETIRQHLQEDQEESGIVPEQSAMTACLDIANQIEPQLIDAPNLKYAGCMADDGEISLVVQSLVTDRRLSFRITPNGQNISASLIDEHMEQRTVQFPTNNCEKAIQLAAWAIGENADVKGIDVEK